MFVSKRRFILKTCGTTLLLQALVPLLELAREYSGFDSIQVRNQKSSLECTKKPLCYYFKFTLFIKYPKMWTFIYASHNGKNVMEDCSAVAVALLSKCYLTNAIVLSYLRITVPMLLSAKLVCK